MADERIIVQLASPERKYVKVYHDFLDNSFLSVEEQMIFIVLKSYVDFKEDSGEVFPSIATLCKRAKMSKPRTIKAIKNLIEKGIVKKVQRGLTKTNLYTLSDYAMMWACDNVEDVAVVADNKGVKPLTLAEHIAELERMGYKVEIKEKGLESVPTKAQNQAPKNKLSSQQQDTTPVPKSQELERYTLDQIRQLFDYDIMIQDNPYKQQDIDSVMDILHTIMNTTKQIIRIGKENKPAIVVIGKLMKLNKESIIYAINKFAEQTGRIRNTTAYMLTILYNAPEQFNLDIQNQMQHNMNNWNNNAVEYQGYNYNELEKQLLG